MAEVCGSIRVTYNAESKMQEKNYIKETEIKIKSLVGADFIVLYNGGLSWTIRPALKEVFITGGISL